MPRMMMRQQLHDIVTPHDHDVLSGRGNFVNYHAGNEHFRALVRKHKVAYVACPKQQKGKFSRLIVEEIRARNPPGRFLKQDPVTKLWHDIGEKKALDKTRQALREGAPEIMKEMSGESGDDAPPDTEENSHEGSPAPPLLKTTSLHDATNTRSPRGPTLPTSSTHSQGGQRFVDPAFGSGGLELNDEILPSNIGSGQFHLQHPHRQLMVGNEILGQHSQHTAALGQHSQHGGLGGMSQHSQTLGQHSQHGTLGQRSQHGNPLGASRHSQHGNPLGQHTQHDPMLSSNFAAQASLQNGMRSLAELRQQMMQQMNGYSAGGVSGFMPNNLNGVMFQQQQQQAPSMGMTLQSKIASLNQMQQAMFQQQQQMRLITNLGDSDDDDDDDGFEFEPRPIAPGFEVQSYPRISGETNNNKPMPAPKKVSNETSNKRGAGLEREGSEKSLNMDGVFAKEIAADLKSEQSSNNMSAGSIMSLSIGDIGKDIDEAEVDPMPPPKSLNAQELMEGAEDSDPEELSAIFDSSMKIKMAKLPGCNHQYQRSSSNDNSADIGRALDMSVNTLGDSVVLYNGDASMGMNFGESFSNVFETVEGM